MRIVLEGERPVSWNQFYSGKHWTHRRQAAANVRLLMRSVLDPDAEPFTVPVAVTVTVYFRDHPQDADNVCAKLYIDGLKGFILADDSPAHVVRVMTCSVIDPLRPRVEIEVVAA